MKLTAVIIVFNGNFVLKQVLESLYDHVGQILISEGPVSYWQDKGYTTSTDGTNEIIDHFPDTKNTIKVIHGQYEEKTEQANAVMHLVNPDTDYLLQVDSDECWKGEDLEKLKDFLVVVRPDSVAVRSCTFYGGFDRYLTGFEQLPNNFRRVFKYEKGATWASHRPPRLTCENFHPKHIDGDKLFEHTGIQMYHYSYVFPTQVFEKIRYYTESLNPMNIIPNYFNMVYLRWVLGGDYQRQAIEDIYNGVHEYRNRMECFTAPFEGEHPEAIKRDLSKLWAEYYRQLEEWLI
jgi:glycosyltransferase involved in cell wall biosynthesis